MCIQSMRESHFRINNELVFPKLHSRIVFYSYIVELFNPTLDWWYKSKDDDNNDGKEILFIDNNSIL